MGGKRSFWAGLSGDLPSLLYFHSETDGKSLPNISGPVCPARGVSRAPALPHLSLSFTFQPSRHILMDSNLHSSRIHLWTLYCVKYVLYDIPSCRRR